MATNAPAAPWRSRIVGEGEEAPDQLLANPQNWRIHPKAQQDALAGVLSEVGWVQRVIVNQQTGHVVDGHARIGLAISRQEPSVPVVYVDLTPDEEAKVLATLDPLSAMAGTDTEVLDQLLRDVSTGDAALQGMLDSLAARAGLVPPIDPAEEWQGMPAFDQPDAMPHRTIYMHFADDDAVRDFAQLVQQAVTDKTKYLWYPPQARGSTIAQQYVSDEP